MRPDLVPPLTPRAQLRWTVVRPIVASLRPATILELGCGLGAVGARLAQTAAYVGAEPDEQSYAVAASRIGAVGGTVIHGDHTAVPPGQRFDLVAAFEVLEHIEDDEGALAQWLPLVRPGGHLLLSVPADPSLFGLSDVAAGHYRRYTADDLRQRLEAAGADVAVIRHYGWPLGNLLESARNSVLRKRDLAATGTTAERTAGSGRLLQPRSSTAGRAIRLGVAPFALLQRLRPNTGPGLIALARVGAPTGQQNGAG